MVTIKHRRGTASQWSTQNPVLAPGEKGFEIDSGKFKMGDGVQTWAQLEYFAPSSEAPEIDLVEADLNIEGVVKGIFLDSADDLPAGFPVNRLVIVRGTAPVIPIPGLEPPVILGEPLGAWNNGATPNYQLTMPKPPNLQAGDVVVAFMRSQSSTATEDWSSPGFTRVGPDFVPTSATHRLNGIFMRRVTDPATEPADYPFSFVGAGGRNTGIILALRGVDLETPIAGFNASYTGSTNNLVATSSSYELDGPAIQFVMAVNENTTDVPAQPSFEPEEEFEHLMTFATQAAITATRTGVSVYAKSYPLQDVDQATPTVVITRMGNSSQAVQSVAFRGIVP